MKSIIYYYLSLIAKLDHRRAVTVVIAILSESADSTNSTFWRKAYIDLPLINTCCLCAAKMVGQLLRAAGQNIGGFMPSDLRDVTVFPRCAPHLPHDKRGTKEGYQGLSHFVKPCDARCLCQDTLRDITTDKASGACKLHLPRCRCRGGAWRSWRGGHGRSEARSTERWKTRQTRRRQDRRSYALLESARMHVRRPGSWFSIIAELCHHQPFPVVEPWHAAEAVSRCRNKFVRHSS